MSFYSCRVCILVTVAMIDWDEWSHSGRCRPHWGLGQHYNLQGYESFTILQVDWFFVFCILTKGNKMYCNLEAWSLQAVQTDSNNHLKSHKQNITITKYVIIYLLCRYLGLIFICSKLYANQMMYFELKSRTHNKAI